MSGLRRVRDEMTDEGLIHGESQFPVSMTLLVALSLLIVGLLAAAGLLWNVGPLR
jgi:putative membrane protein